MSDKEKAAQAVMEMLMLLTDDDRAQLVEWIRKRRAHHAAYQSSLPTQDHTKGDENDE